MKFSYKKLWKLLIDNHMIKKDLMEKANINATTIANMSKGNAVNMETLRKICILFRCNIGDIVDVLY